eukprot:TRINITY_DN55844_c0_g1_i1.p1 TRINITY_DN55844_c0_g1~~TRINITY_DN55844_c0_g1_i1.p1  ORF type:complete len:220 (+),score=73.91 TRINITY_DN55844_c0_g1_i1:87-662(+)
MALTSTDKWQIIWIMVNFYIHFGWEISLLFMFDYMQWGGWSPYNAFCHAFYAYGDHDRRYRVEPATSYGSNIDKVVLAVEVPAGIIDGILCVFWLYAILGGTWYRYPVQLVVSALHAFGTIVFWADEFLVGWMSWYKGKGWVYPNSNGPNDFGFWWAFIGTNLVWVVVPWLCCSSAMRHMKPALRAHFKTQ